ncbi:MULTISPECIES: hypothetical protein [unclassified Microcoleus]|uniref:hypothetical protein n=1 Tax=unclassified Microcoleus TaxID=2642155 RepID=UPI002FD068CA
MMKNLYSLPSLTMNYSVPMAKILQSLMVATALALPLSVMTAKSVLAEALGFNIINKTGTNITKFYTNPTGIDSWGEDILGIDILRPGESALITIRNSQNVCTYDIKAVFDDGEEIIKYKVDLCTIENYTFTD